MARIVAALIVLATLGASTGQAQVFDLVNLDRLNGKLCGRVVDHTWNHGQDRRICSPILGMERDLYVYLPPGYDPAIAYPLIVYLHGADLDEHAFLDPKDLLRLDAMMARGEMTRAVIAAPDGTYEGKNRIVGTHSLWVNGLGGRFEDHIVQEVVPFLTRTYSIRPERESHALLGISAGGYGAMGDRPQAPRRLRRRGHPGRAAQHALLQRPGALWRRLRPAHLPRADRLRRQRGHRPLLLRAPPPEGKNLPRPGLWHGARPRDPRQDPPG